MANNLEKALLAIAQSTAEAKKVAENAETAAKNVTMTTDDKGMLSVNGKPQNIKLLQPATVAAEVASALSSSDLPSKLAEEQAAFEKQQSGVNMKIAVERGIYYIEDALPSALRNKALTGWWKDNKQTPEEAAIVSSYIQSYINALPGGVYVTARFGSVFSVDKNRGALPELFGEDGRSIKRGGMTLVIDGQQPCIYIDNSQYRVYDFSGVMFIAESLGINVFEMGGGSEGNQIKHGGILRTRAWLEFGYVKGAARDKMLFAPIDGWTHEKPNIGHGFADKGVHEAGFNTTTLSHDISCYRNNGYHVEDVQQPEGMNKDECYRRTYLERTDRYQSVGGYWDENGLSAFPQDDGTTSRKWGKWRGGQRGSRGNAWTLYNARNTHIHDFDVRGFDGSAIQLGLYGTQSGQDVGAGDVAFAEANGMVAYNTVITGGYFTENYTGGIGLVRAVDTRVEGLHCADNKVGHPDWSVEHSRDGNGVTIDPGYMLWTSRYSPMTGVVFRNNFFGVAARKVIDAHTGNNIVIDGNRGRAGFYGISVVIEERFASEKDVVGAKAEKGSYYYQESNMLIINNNVSGIFGIHLENGATGVKARKNAELVKDATTRAAEAAAGGFWWLRANMQVHNNIIKSPYVGIAYHFGHYGFDITKNSVTYSNEFGIPFDAIRLNEVKVINGGSGYSDETYLTITGGGEKANRMKVEPVISEGVIQWVRIRQTGSWVTDPDSIVVTAIDPKGTGSGATFKATNAYTAIAYNVGSLERYGTCVVNFQDNTMRNSRDGNFVRALVSDNCWASTFAGNRFDVTPYAKGSDERRPYVSEKDFVFRSGQAVQLVADGTHTDCHHENNRGYNALKGVAYDIVFTKTKTTANGTDARNRKVSESEFSALDTASKGLTTKVQALFA